MGDLRFRDFGYRIFTKYHPGLWYSAYPHSMRNICRILTKFCPEKSVKEIQNIIYIFFPFMFGIYPYSAVTDKQMKAMKEANVDFVYQSVFDITNNCLLKLL